MVTIDAGRKVWVGGWWGGRNNDYLEEPNCSMNGRPGSIGSGVQRDRNLWSCEDRKGYSPEDQCFLSISPEKQ